MDDRLRELEIKITYQEQLVETLNQVVIEQGKVIERMGKQIELLTDRVRAATPVEEPANEPPPHY